MNKFSEEMKLLGDSAFANSLHVIHHAYVDITGGIIEGSLLGQILYWFGAGKDGTSRARIERDGHLWIAKTRNDWWDEIRISPKQYDRASKILKDKGFIEIKTMKFNGNPTTHIRINAGVIGAALDAWKLERVKTMFPDQEKPTAPTVHTAFSPVGQRVVEPVVPQRSITDYPIAEHQVQPVGNMDVYPNGISSYTENTNKEYDKDHHNQPGAVGDVQAHYETMKFIQDSFEQAWSEYPRKEGKQKAFQAFERSVRGIGTRKADGTPYTAEEIILQVKLYAAYMERRVADGEANAHHIARGDSWFVGERWMDEFPTISSRFDDYEQGVEYNRTVAKARQITREIGQAKDASTVEHLRAMFGRLLTAL